jgi:hypothetical protein
MSSPIPVPPVPVQGTLFYVIRVVPDMETFWAIPFTKAELLKCSHRFQTLIPNLLKPLLTRKTVKICD